MISRSHTAARRGRPALASDATAEARRLSLARLGLLDTPPEEEFDGLVKLAAAVCEVPTAMLTFLDGDRAWYKSSVGLSHSEAPIAYSLCSYAVGTPEEPTVVEEVIGDHRLGAYPELSSGELDVRAYAAMPVLDVHGTPLGAVCVIDVEPRGFSEAQVDGLRTVARQVEALLRHRTRVSYLQTVQQALSASNEQLDQFAYIMAHDLLAPIRHQTSFAEVLEEDFAALLPPEARAHIANIRRAGDRASALIRDIATYVHSSHTERAPSERVELGEVVLDVFAATSVPPGVSFQLEGAATVDIEVNRAALYHILQNLLSNAAKFVAPDSGRIAVRIEGRLDTVCIEVEDDGIGMTRETAVSVFELFQRGDNVGEREGRGLGLSIARKLAHGLCGELTVESEGEGRGTIFRLELPREDWFGIGRPGADR